MSDIERFVDLREVQFVTAIYTGLEGTRFNGNSGGIYERYKQSLMSLAAGGYYIVCFTSASTIEELKLLFKDYENLFFVQHELSEYPVHAEIESIKDLHPKYTTEDAWRSRCVEIMWGKFNWMYMMAARGDRTKPHHTFWIDAGIFHGGLVSNTFRSEASKGFYDFDTITQHRDLYADLVKFADGKIINITTNIVNHGSDDYQVVFGERPEYSVIGGIFGGDYYKLMDYILEFNAAANRVLDNKLLVKEEEIMYYLHTQNPEKYSVYHFNNWYHQDWPVDLFNPEIHTSFSDFFKVIRD